VEAPQIKKNRRGAPEDSAGGDAVACGGAAPADVVGPAGHRTTLGIEMRYIFCGGSVVSVGG